MRKPVRNIFQHSNNDAPERIGREHPQRWLPESPDGSERIGPGAYAYPDHNFTNEGPSSEAGFEDAGRGRSAVGRDIWGCLRRHKLLIASIATLSMATLTTVILIIPPTYEATSAVIFQGDRQNAVRVDDGQREPSFGPDTLANEIELLLSEELLTTVATTLDLVHNPEFNKPPGFHVMDEVMALAATVADQLPQPWGRDALASLRTAVEAQPHEDEAHRALSKTVAALRAKLTIGPVGTSRVIRIAAQSQRAETATLIANTMATAYTTTLTNMTAATTQEAHHWIEQRLDDLRGRAAKSAMAYEALRHDSGLTRGKDSTISQEQITQVSTELTLARQRRAEADAILAQSKTSTGADLDQLATSSGSVLLGKLRELLAVATAKKADLESSGGLNLPNVIAIRAQVADINRSINAERDRVRQTLQSKAVIAQASEARLAATLEDLKSKIGNSENSAAQMQALERDAMADRELYTSFINRARQTDPEVNYQSATARILSRATVPLDPRSPNKRVLFPAALVLSLVLGMVAAVSKEGRRRGLHSMSDVQGIFGQPSLGMLPWVRRNDRRLVRVFEEAVAQVLARVMLPITGPAPASILITSAVPREGKTNTAIAMAAAATARGLKVLLVDADLRRRSLSVAAGLAQSEHSLVQLLQGDTRLADAVVFHEKWGFDVLPAGAVGGSPMPLLATGAWTTVLQDIAQVYDLAIIDTPPVLVAGDTWLLAGPCDRTIVVSRWGSTPSSTVELALSQLASARARIAGIVLTMVAHREHASYGYEDSIMFSPKLMQWHNRTRRLA